MSTFLTRFLKEAIVQELLRWLDPFEKRLYNSFVSQMILVHLQASERKYTRAIPKHMKTYESG